MRSKTALALAAILASAPLAALAEPAVAPTLSAGPAAPETTPSTLAPFGPGASVEVTAKGSPVGVYVAKLDYNDARPADEDFKKVGITPVTFVLPPGNFLLEAEGPAVTRGTRLIRMRGASQRLIVETGSDGLGTTGTLLTAVGIAAVAAGIVVLVGGSPNSEGGIQQSKLTIPLFVGGGIAIAGGVTMMVLSRTDVENQHEPSAGRARLPRPRSCSTRDAATIALAVVF